jgi:hypothetical protein
MLVAIAIAGTSVSGCSSIGDPTAAPTPSVTTATSTPAPAPEPISTLEISSHGIRALERDGDEVASADYADGGDAVVAVLETTFGPPETIIVPEDNQCFLATYYRWGETDSLKLEVPVDDHTWPHVPTLSTGAASVNGVDVVTSSGLRVGDDDERIYVLIAPGSFGSGYC